jgi:uncharacterized protein (DUF3820 family)
VFNPDDLIKIITYPMPFGKHQGQVLFDVPENYLLWLRNNEFPSGELGKLLGLVLEIKINGLESIIEPIRKKTSLYVHTTSSIKH